MVDLCVLDTNNHLAAAADDEYDHISVELQPQQ
jgi:hypothetical protein